MSAASAPSFAPKRVVVFILIAQAIIGLVEFLSQIILRRELQPGEFGTVNTVLGVVAVAAGPMFALTLVPRHGILSHEESTHWRDLLPGFMRLATLGLGGVSLVLLFALLPFLSLPRLSLQMFAVLAVEATLAARLGVILCRATNRLGFLAGLMVTGACVRLAVTSFGAHAQPLAQSGVGAFILAGAIVGLPTLQDYSFPSPGTKGWALWHKLLLPVLATASVLLALVLFTNAHRIVAQPNFGVPDSHNYDYVDLNGFDDFQAAGLIAHWVLMGGLLLLVIFYKKRVVLDRTTHASLRWFWIYLGALVTGVVLLVVAAPLANVIFTGNSASYLPAFAAPVFMLGLVQGMAVFSLASRRWIECFVVGATSIAYTFFLYYAGHQPQLMATCMFGGALISLMLLLFVGVVRYARSHP